MTAGPAGSGPRPSARRAAIVCLVAAGALFLQGCGLFRGGSRTPARTAGERISVLDFERQVEAEAELQGIEVILPQAEVNATWTKPGGSASGVMGHLALNPEVSRIWSARIGRGSDATRRLNAGPVIAENRLFVMDTEARVTAFEASTGRILWQQPLAVAAEGPRSAFGGGVSIGEGRVFATTGQGVAAALDPANGAIVWRQSLGAPLRGAPGLDGGRLFVTTQDGQLLALSAGDGTTLWEVNSTVEPAAVMGPGSPSVALDTVVAGFPSGELFALRVENGRTVWQDQLARTGRTTALGALSGIAASPVIDRGRVFAIGHGGRMAALELATGVRVWERDFAGVNMPWAAGEWVFAVTVDAQLVALARGDGRIRWMTQLPRWRNPKRRSGGIEWSGPVLAGDRLFLVSSTGEMATVDPRTGTLVGTTRLAGPAYLPPVVANAILYVLTDDGTLTAYR